MNKIQYILIGIGIIISIMFITSQTTWYKNSKVSSVISKLSEIKIAEFNTELPEEMPKDIVMHYTYSEGMLPHSDEIHITLDSQTYTYTREGMDFNEEGIRERVINMNVTPEEIETIYLQLKRYGFDKIETEKEDDITYDSGTLRIYMSYKSGDDEVFIDVHDSGSEHVKEDSRGQWQASLQIFRGLVEVYGK